MNHKLSHVIIISYWNFIFANKLINDRAVFSGSQYISEVCWRNRATPPQIDRVRRGQPFFVLFLSFSSPRTVAKPFSCDSVESTDASHSFASKAVCFMIPQTNVNTNLDFSCFPSQRILFEEKIWLYTIILLFVYSCWLSVR